MKLNELKQKINEADESNLEDVDSLCARWLRDAADDHGKEGKTAQKLLAIFVDLLDICAF